MNTCTVEKNLEKRDKKNLGEETFVDEQSNLKYKYTPSISEIIWVRNVRAIVVCGFLMK